jgi:hypothetical protein
MEVVLFFYNANDSSTHRFAIIPYRQARKDKK